MRGASSYNASHLIVVGAPGGYAAVSASLEEDGGGLEGSPVVGAVENQADLRLTSVYMASLYTAVAAAESGAVFYSNDMTRTWQSAQLPQGLEKSSWLAMSGRNAEDEANAARPLHASTPALVTSLSFGLLGAAVTWVRH